MGLEKAFLDLEPESPDIDIYEEEQGRDLVMPEINEQPLRIPTSLPPPPPPPYNRYHPLHLNPGLKNPMKRGKN